MTNQEINTNIDFEQLSSTAKLNLQAKFASKEWTSQTFYGEDFIESSLLQDLIASLIPDNKIEVMILSMNLQIPDADVTHGHDYCDMYNVCRRTVIHRIKEAIEDDWLNYELNLK